MGTASREKPKRLAEKLLQIRLELCFSQNELLKSLNLENKFSREEISKYERGIREPSLLTLLRYAQVVGVSTDVLIDDKVDLPTILSKK